MSLSLSPFPLFSIIIPSRNEAEDIAATLEACLALGYAPFEIIVVDDSTDNTPEIVESFAYRGVKLVHRQVNHNGCCGARNLGMQVAKGEFIVLLNADDRLPSDFLQRLLEHYKAGADFIISRSSVANCDCIWGKYILAGEIDWLQKGKPLGWSEGFSARRSAVEAIGYIPGDFPVPFCRDYMLGMTLEKAGFVKHVDLDIKVRHVVPATLKTFWNNRVWRGTMSSPHAYFFRRLSIPLIAGREILKALKNMGLRVLLIPHLWRDFQRSQALSGQWRNIPDLFVAGTIDDLAMIVGNFKGLIRLVRLEHDNEKH
jgi:glycosyltransferase involved in cell wall biosynthesis